MSGETNADKYARYGRPLPPADVNQEYMTVQETAFVLKCGVQWLRRFLKANPRLRSMQGRRIVTNRAAREAIYRQNAGKSRAVA